MRPRSLRRRACGAILVGAGLVVGTPLTAAGASASGAVRERAAGAGLHPQDGPHADLRFDLVADAFVADVSMNLTFLDELIEPAREQSDRLELSELRQMRPRLLERMRSVCRVAVDGVPVEPRMEDLAMNDPDEALLPLFPRSGMRGLRKIRFRLEYPVPTAEPASISIVWDFFPPDELSLLEPKPPLVLAAELTAEGVRSQLEFRKDEPEFIWRSTPGGLDARLLAVPRPSDEPTRTLSLPALALGVAGVALLALKGRGTRRGPAIGAGLSLLAAGALAQGTLARGRVTLGGGGSHVPTVEEAASIFRPLHANLYRSFDFTDESAIYDALARSIDGPLLEDLYLTIHRSLVMQEEGGAMSRVRGVREVALTVDAVGLLPASTGHGAEPASGEGSASEVPGFVITYRYQVDGRVTHWGHAHDRTNEYLARYAVVARPEGWRIAEAEVLEQSRVDGLDVPIPLEPPVEPEVGRDGSFEL